MPGPVSQSYDGPYDQNDVELACCPICHAEMEWVECWQCHGNGGFHDCGEDCCPCLDKEEITVDCDECDGEGGYLACASMPHTDEQMAAYRPAPPASSPSPEVHRGET